MPDACGPCDKLSASLALRNSARDGRLELPGLPDSALPRRGDSLREQRGDKTVEEFAEDSGSDVPVGGKVLGPEVLPRSSESRGGSESVDCVAVGFGHLHRWA